MCRFLLARSHEPLDIQSLLSEFALMCESSRAPDGDRQGDGWGIAWKEENGWQIKKSLSPIWEEQDRFTNIPPTRLLAIHARSAGFPQHKGNIEFNQPYINEGWCFVFNGMLRGVSIPRKLSGAIGAQRIFSFLQEETAHATGDQALETLDRTFLAHTRRIDGMNVGLVKDDRLYALCEYADNEEYFSLRYYQDPHLAMICSASLPGFLWQKMKKGQVISL